MQVMASIFIPLTSLVFPDLGFDCFFNYKEVKSKDIAAVFLAGISCCNRFYYNKP